MIALAKFNPIVIHVPLFSKADGAIFLGRVEDSDWDGDSKHSCCRCKTQDCVSDKLRFTGNEWNKWKNSFFIYIFLNESLRMCSWYVTKESLSFPYSFFVLGHQFEFIYLYPFIYIYVYFIQLKTPWRWQTIWFLVLSFSLNKCI